MALQRFARDTFTGIAAGSDLALWSGGETGHAWGKYSTRAAQGTADGRVRSFAGSVTIYAALVDPTTADYEARGRVRCVTNMGTGGLLVRADPVAGDAYAAYFRNGTGWRLARFRGGASTALADDAASHGTALIDGAEHDLTLAVSGAGASVSLTLSVGGVAVLSHADADAARITSAGYAGITGTSATSDAAGYHIDDFEAWRWAADGAYRPWLAGPASVLGGGMP